MSKWLVLKASPKIHNKYKAYFDKNSIRLSEISSILVDSSGGVDPRILGFTWMELIGPAADDQTFRHNFFILF